MTLEQINLEQQVAELIAVYEISMDRIAEREKILEEQFESSEKFLNTHIKKIHALMTDLREVMTEAGAARWRAAAQEALKLGDTQLKTVQKLTEETKNVLDEGCNRFEQSSHSAAQHLHNIIENCKVEDFKSYIEKSYEEVDKNAAAAAGKMTEILRWFQWRNILLTFSLSIFTAILVGLYINDEWPWELRANIVKERAAGEALLKAWPHLSKADQKYIESTILDKKTLPPA